MPYEDWNEIEDEDQDELQDASVGFASSPTIQSAHPIAIQWVEGKRDVILFCIDCSESMQELRDDPVYEGVQTSHLLGALDAAMQIQKRKAIVGPADSVGILFFNTVRRGILTDLTF